MQHRNHLPQNRLGQTDADDIMFKDFYVYQENFNGLAPGASQTGNINIQADSDFVVQKLTYFATIADAAQTADTRVIPLISLQITDAGSGRNLFEEAVSVPAIFGTGELPFILPTPKLFSARSTITINISNFDAAATYRINLSFIGYKIFRTGQ